MQTLRPAAPRVTVLLPVLDGERFLAEAVESILAQSFRGFELLAIDDGSRDGSAAILEAFARRDPRVRVVRRPHTGLVATLNAGLALAEAALIARMDADDVALPQRLEGQLARLAREPELVCIGGAFELIDEAGRAFDRAFPPCDHAAILARALRGESPISHSRGDLRRDLVRRLGGYDEKARWGGSRPLAASLGAGAANLPDLVSSVITGAPLSGQRPSSSSRRGAWQGLMPAPRARRIAVSPRLARALGSRLAATPRARARALRLADRRTPDRAALRGPRAPDAAREPSLLAHPGPCAEGASAARPRMTSLSVVMPVFDAERFVAIAVASLLGQTHTDFELLIFDDGSQDRTAEIIEGFRDPRIRLLRKPHAGYAIWLREGVQLSRGEFVARMDADDAARPQRFEKQLAHLRRHPECVALGAEVLLVDPKGRPIGERGVPLQHEAIEAELLEGRGGALVHPSAIFRREALLAVGGYRPEHEPAEDLDLYLRLAEKGRLANLPDTLLEHRLHVGKVSAERAGEQRRRAIAIVRDARLRRGLPLEGDRLPAVAESLAAVDYWHYWARSAIRGGRLSTARRYAFAVLIRQPFAVRSWKLLASALLGERIHGLKRLREWRR
jgi:glycosyltransferase involved in cell wall biosynthesis